MQVHSKIVSLLPKGIQESEAARKQPEQLLQKRDSLKRRHWLEIVEWASLAGSVAGTLAVALSGQLLNAAVGSGLALTISASLVNRHRIELRNRQQTEAAIADVHQVIKSLYFQFQKLAADPLEIEPMHQTLYQLGMVTERLESRSASAEDVQGISVEVSLMRSAIFDLQSELEVLANKSIEITPIQEKIDQINQRLDELPAPFDPRDIYAKIAELEQKNQQIVKPYLQRLVRQVKQLEQTNENLTSEVDILTEQFYNRPELKQMQGLQGIVAQLVKNVDQLQNLPDAEKLSYAIANLSNKLDSLSEQLKNGGRSQPMAGLSDELAHLPLFREIEDLQSALAKLNGGKNTKAASGRVASPKGKNGHLGKGD